MTLVLNLRGRILEEVKEETSKIKKGKTFSSFAEFDQCLDL